jgi:glutamate dehydrogenase (NADP+)
MRNVLIRRRDALRKALAGDLSLLKELRQQSVGDVVDAALDSAQDEISSQLAEVESRELASIEKALEMGAKVLTFSDSSGFVFDPDGIDEEKLAFIKDLKEVRRGRVNEYAEKFGRAEFHAGQNPWSVQAVCEGANMPTALEGVHAFLKARILFGPAKAANAGGVAVSGLEQSQNALRISWDHEEVDRRLKAIMRDIHSKCVEHGRDGDQFVNYVDGANIAGFLKVAEAMLAYGAV